CSQLAILRGSYSLWRTAQLESTRSPRCLVTLRPPPTSTPFPYTTLFRSTGLHPEQPVRCPSRSSTDCRTFPMPHRQQQASAGTRSEEHTSELQSRFDLVCRLLLEKKNEGESTPD